MATENVHEARIRRIKYMLDRVASGADDADACRDMAQRLMERHSIEEWMLPDRERQVVDEITQEYIEFTGIYCDAYRKIAIRIAGVNSCRIVVSNRSQSKRGVTLTGWKTDLDNVKLLNASVQMQCAAALKEWLKTRDEIWNLLSAMEKFKERREFIYSFARGVASKLVEARKLARHEATVARAQETGDTFADTKIGVDLALRDRDESVNDWYDKFYGKSLRNVRSYRSSGSGNAQANGYVAGRTADTGQSRVHGGRRAIES